MGEKASGKLFDKVGGKTLWVTLDLLVDRRGHRSTQDLDEWLDAVTGRAPRSDTPTSAGIPDLPVDKTRRGRASSDATTPNFSHPHIRNRLEKLMGSNIVRITDRRYMQRLQERIYEDHLEQQKKRMKDREAAEVEREKQLILAGRIPMEEASAELYDHPVIKVTRLAQACLDERKATRRVKPLPRSIFKRIFDVETEDLGETERELVTGLTPSKFMRRMSSMIIRTDEDETQRMERELLEDEDDVTRGYMFTEDDYDLLKYEAPLVKMLRKCTTVDEMYRLADEIIGVLRTMKSERKTASVPAPPPTTEVVGEQPTVADAEPTEADTP